MVYNTLKINKQAVTLLQGVHPTLGYTPQNHWVKALQQGHLFTTTHHQYVIKGLCPPTRDVFVLGCSHTSSHTSMCFISHMAWMCSAELAWIYEIPDPGSIFPLSPLLRGIKSIAWVVRNGQTPSSVFPFDAAAETSVSFCLCRNSITLVESDKLY